MVVTSGPRSPKGIAENQGIRNAPIKIQRPMMTDHLHGVDTESVLANEDLLPTKQTWNWYNIFAFWMSDVHSAGGYVFAGTLFSLGLAGWQVFVSLILGIVIVQILANIIGVPSQRYAVPFPVPELPADLTLNGYAA